MAEVRWTPQAADDLDAIAEFIARDSATFAGLFSADVLDAVSLLKVNPEIGRVVPEFSDAAVRELIVGNYRVIYRLRADVVEILTVFHGARLLGDEDIQ